MTGAMSLPELAQLINPGTKTAKAGVRLNIQCPAHEDRTPSLTIWHDSRGKVAFNCHAGCSHDRIVAALPPAALDYCHTTWGTKSTVVSFPTHTPAPATGDNYPYVDENGQIAYVVKRGPNKKFSQWHPNGDGKLAKGRGSHPLIPYRLPDVIAAKQAGDPIFIVEGEKDADRLAALGLTATCNPGGACKWTDDLSGWFTDARVVILPDNDTPGRDHAQQVSDRLTNVVEDLKICHLPNLPDKGDVSDWLDAGGTVERLLKLAAETEKTITTGPFGDVYTRSGLARIPPPEYHLGPYIQKGAYNLLFGGSTAGKSFLALAWSAAIATGTNWGPHQANGQHKVLYWAAEGRSGLHSRLTAWEQHNGVLIPDEQLVVPATWPTLDQAAKGQAVADWCLENNIGLCCIDTLSRVKGNLKENDNDDLGTILMQSIDALTSAGITNVLIHHAGWSATNRPRGAKALFDQADQVYGIERDNTFRVLRHYKNKEAEENHPLQLEAIQIAGSMVLEPTDRIQLSDPAEQLLHELEAIYNRTDGVDWTTTSQLSAATGLDRKRIGEALNPIDGIKVDSRKQSGKPTRWRFKSQQVLPS